MGQYLKPREVYARQLRRLELVDPSTFSADERNRFRCRRWYLKRRSAGLPIKQVRNAGM